jgi:hypothetical protein
VVNKIFRLLLLSENFAPRLKLRAYGSPLLPDSAFGIDCLRIT